VAAGEATPEDALERLAWLPVEAVGGRVGHGTDPGGSRDPSQAVDPVENGGEPFARLDHHRPLRQGHPEVVFGPGKAPEQLVEIGRRFADRGDGFLVTRLEEGAPRDALVEAFPDGVLNALGRTFHQPPAEPFQPKVRGPVLVVTGGTGDIPVAEEAAVTAVAFGNPTERLYDVGVAGIHRVLREAKTLGRAAVVIVVAGMEGALPSVVGGLVGTPVIAVPTSVGYGAAFGGLAPLLGMLNSCAAGVTVVNIDNGFGAAVAASRINQLPDPGPEPESESGSQSDPPPTDPPAADTSP
jgi:NCAIR mutase (PurE)-related protein